MTGTTMTGTTIPYSATPRSQAVVLTGARQTGKSTLVEKLVPGERRYRSLEDFDVRDAARRDPEALLGGTDPLTLDEVQREPGLLTAVKRAIDRDRRGMTARKTGRRSRCAGGFPRRRWN
jgi:predicted AAA+ superfamily ATPase